jgi:Fic family protein
MDRDYNKSFKPNDNKGKRITTRRKILSKLIQEAREDAIERDFEIMSLQNLDNRLTRDEKNQLYAEGENGLQDQIEYCKAAKTAAIIRLETFKEIRDGKPEINTDENRKYFESAPSITVSMKK